MTTREAPELVALAAKMRSAVCMTSRLTMFSEEEVMGMAEAVEFSESASMLGTVSPEKAARIDAIHAEGACMAAAQMIHDAMADELLSEAQGGGSEWLLEINDGEDD